MTVYSFRYISAVHLTEKGCPEMRDDGLSNFETNVSRAQVNWDVDEEKPGCALVQPEKGHTMIQMEGTCGTEILAEELIEGFTFEPRCLVLVMAEENERAMFDSMLAAGRLLTDEFEIRVNYTIATGADPDVKLASTNCHNSHVLLRNYELDTTGQADRDELEDVREDIRMYTALIAFTKHLMTTQALVTTDSNGFATLLSPKPSPPPPPPPLAELASVYTPNHPPAPPETVGASVVVQRYEDALGESQAREVAIVAKLNDCFVVDRADDTVCGLSSNEAPHPWIALNDVKCRGYATLSTREEDYCGYCKIFSIQTDTLYFAHLALSLVAQGSRTSTRSRPTASCARSCSRWGRFASTPGTGLPTALPTRREPCAAASPTSST